MDVLYHSGSFSYHDLHMVNCEVGYVFKTIQLCKKDDSQFWKKNPVFVGEGVGMSVLRTFIPNEESLPKYGGICILSELWKSL